MFQFPTLPSLSLYIQLRDISKDRLSHSEICASKDTCSSAQLIAAYHVLLRQSVPRHPPYTLSILINVLNLDDYVMYFISNIKYVKEQKKNTSSLLDRFKRSVKRLTKQPNKKDGGDDRDWTCDPLRARQMLSQLSYIPKFFAKKTRW